MEETGTAGQGRCGRLAGINRARKQDVERGEKTFRMEKVRKYKEEYREVLREGRRK